VALAVRALRNKEVKRIILTRPAVEAGENLGFLPGDMKEKLDPYMQPLYDALRDMIPTQKLITYLEEGVIEIAPLAFMRGRTLDNAFVILDEAQNTTFSQLKMFLTRMGRSAKFIVTGDLTQIDLPRNQKSGLIHATHLLKNIKGIDFIFLNTTDIIRHKLVTKIKGKVRDVYFIDDALLVMVTSDRISAFDKVLPRAIPYKGQVLNQIASKFLDATTDILPNWKIATPDPSVTIGRKCDTFPVEMIIRGYLTGSSWRTYKKGIREICGVKIPDGMKEHERFPEPIITPTTKADQGHDEDISKEEILAQKLVSAEDYKKLEEYTYALYKRGCEIAEKQGLILVDTKYEFGKIDNKIFLIDEVHTPDSSRYFYKDEYQQRFDNGEPQKQLSKEFVREWLMENGFQGQEGQKIPEMSDELVQEISERYIELYEKITGDRFIKTNIKGIQERLEHNISNFLKVYNNR